MDANRFDALARSFEDGIPRRAALGGALGAGFGSLLVLFGATDVSAKKKKKKKKCKGNKQKCGKKCILKTECCVDTDCPAGATCEAGSCVCGLGETNCGDTCADLVTDGENCGTCGNACATGDCVHGTCACTSADDCPEGCGCIAREEGGSACATTPETQESCDDDDDCPLGAFCVDAGIIQFCSGVCQG